VADALTPEESGGAGGAGGGAGRFEAFLAGLDPAVAARARAALAGRPSPRLLALGALVPGDAGIVEAQVRQVHPLRPFARARGGDGLVGRVTLGDASGEANLVLWDDETRLVQDGPFVPGARLRLQGVTVRAGRRGDCELALGAAVVTPLEGVEERTEDLEGTLLAVGPARVLGDPPRVRFQADAELAVAGGTARLAVEGEALLRVRRVLPGVPVRIRAVRPHPALEGWWLATPGTRIEVG